MIEEQRLVIVDVPEWKWDSIARDFVTYLPRSVVVMIQFG